MPHPPACTVCGHPVFDVRAHDIPLARAATMLLPFTCKCGKPARVRCHIVVRVPGPAFNAGSTFWVECEDGHGGGRPA